MFSRAVQACDAEVLGFRMVCRRLFEMVAYIHWRTMASRRYHISYSAVALVFLASVAVAEDGDEEGGWKSESM